LGAPSETLKRIYWDDGNCWGQLGGGKGILGSMGLDGAAAKAKGKKKKYL